MTRPTAMDKDYLAAFVDGELSPEEAAKVVLHLADHPQDQIYVDDLMAANAALAQAFAAPLDEPVPPAMRELILGTGPAKDRAQILPFQPRTRVHQGIATWGGLAAGAALAAGVTLAVFLPADGTGDLAPGPLAAASPLHQALATLPSGQTQALADGSEVTVLSSLPIAMGFCREIEVVHAQAGTLEVGLACTERDGWVVEVVISEGLADAAAAEGFGTASGDEAQSFTPFLDRIGAGPVLGPAEEAAAMARGWKK